MQGRLLLCSETTGPVSEYLEDVQFGGEISLAVVLIGGWVAANAGCSATAPCLRATNRSLAFTCDLPWLQVAGVQGSSAVTGLWNELGGFEWGRKNGKTKGIGDLG
ncbi:hypothetical protein AHAS_Ahas11G0042200 [Arachis hypogaea]